MAKDEARKKMTDAEVAVWAQAAAAVMSREGNHPPAYAAAQADVLIDELRKRMPPGTVWGA